MQDFYWPGLGPRPGGTWKAIKGIEGSGKWKWTKRKAKDRTEERKCVASIPGERRLWIILPNELLRANTRSLAAYQMSVATIIWLKAIRPGTAHSTAQWLRIQLGYITRGSLQCSKFYVHLLFCRTHNGELHRNRRVIIPLCVLSAFEDIVNTPGCCVASRLLLCSGRKKVVIAVSTWLSLL